MDMHSKSMQIIICKYNEDTQWIEEFSHVPHVIYDKKNTASKHYIPNVPSFPVQSFGGARHAKTPTGRESLVYLYHIIKHYQELADINIFMQANPVQDYSDTRKTLRILMQQGVAGVSFLPLNYPLVFCDADGAPLHRGLPVERVFKRLFQGDAPSLVAYSWGAMFCVSRINIHKRPLPFYEEMMQIIFEEPLSGYVYERLWPLVLSCFDFLPHESYPQRKRAQWNLPGLI